MAVRPIDSEKYMELLKEQYLHHKSMGNSQAERAWQGAMQMLYDMPTLTPPNEWMSVDKRLPDEELKRFKELFPGENEVEVLVMIQGAYTATTLYWDGEKFYDEMSSYEVTHWMPLPAPPDKEQTT